MNILSVTFHIEQNSITLWENFMNNQILKIVKNINPKAKYILSKIANNHQEEGENYNIMLIFDDQTARNIFSSEELPKLSKIIQDKFPNQEVMIFVTNLDVLSQYF